MSTIFRLFFQLMGNKTYNGKRVLKPILRSIKKQLAVIKVENVKLYLELVEASSIIMREGVKRVELAKLGQTEITPGPMLVTLRNKHPELYNKLDINEKYVNELVSKYTESGHTFFSVKYMNILYKATEEYMKHNSFRFKEFSHGNNQ